MKLIRSVTRARDWPSWGRSCWWPGHCPRRCCHHPRPWRISWSRSRAAGRLLTRRLQCIWTLRQKLKIELLVLVYPPVTLTVSKCFLNRYSEVLVPKMPKSTTRVTRMKVVFILAKKFPLAKFTEIEEDHKNICVSHIIMARNNAALRYVTKLWILLRPVTHHVTLLCQFYPELWSCLTLPRPPGAPCGQGQ